MIVVLHMATLLSSVQKINASICTLVLTGLPVSRQAWTEGVGQWLRD